MATGDITRAVESMEALVSPSIAASRMRNTLVLLEGLLDQLIEVDDNSVEWEQEVSVVVVYPHSAHCPHPRQPPILLVFS